MTDPANGMGVRPAVPPHALLLSLLSLSVPVLSSSLFPGWTNTEYGFLVWLLALIPAFLLSFHRGWRGASVALAGAMAVFALMQVALLLTGSSAPRPEAMVAAVFILIMVCLGSGWLAERFRQALMRAEQLALTDSGSGLPNRRHAMLHLQRAFAAAERGDALTVVLFDLDHFKQINDRFGHPYGDGVIQQFARLVESETRGMNLSARFGGEEFIAVLDEVSAQAAFVFAERVRRRFAEATAEQASGPLTVSAGVAAYERGMASPEVLVAACDQALYRAKSQGRDRTVVLGRMGQSGEALRVAALSADETAGRGETILVVDDDTNVLRLLVRALKQRGYNPVSAATPEEALALARRLGAAVDLLIVDVIMPAMSGFRLAEMLAAAHSAIRVLYISGYSRDDVDWQGVPGGTKAFLPKPFTIDRLLEAVRALIDAPAPPQTGAAPVLQNDAAPPPDGRAQRIRRMAGMLATELGLGDDEERVSQLAARIAAVADEFEAVARGADRNGA